jgi:hypothetical protein
MCVSHEQWNMAVNRQRKFGSYIIWNN